MSDYDEGAQTVAAMTARDLAANATDVAPVDAEDLDYDDPEPCGEGMCQCACDGSHVCGCDCWHCPYCQQLPEYCDCEDD